MRAGREQSNVQAAATPTNRERIRAILSYRPCDRLPILHFGFWEQTLEKWVQEGRLRPEQVLGVRDGSEAQREIAWKIGFEEDFFNCYTPGGYWYDYPLFPAWDREVLEELPDGFLKVRNADGVIVRERPGATSICSEIDHTLKDRSSWAAHYLPRLRWEEGRIDRLELAKRRSRDAQREEFYGIYCGSLFGKIRNWWGLEAVSYLSVDDPALYGECIATVGELSHKVAQKALETGVAFDYAHFWEDICYRGGPLVNPDLFRRTVGPWYRKITDLCCRHGITLVAVDCDGLVEELVPVWLDNGVNIMFPVEFGSWQYSFAAMRRKFGREVRGVGNVNKGIFSQDRAAVDREIERIRPLVESGGYIPCPDHRIAPDAQWDLLRYYCERMREVFWT